MNRVLKYILLISLVPFFSCYQEIIEESAVEQLLDEYSAALSSKSAQKVAEIFHKEAQLLPEDKDAIQGRAKIQEHFKGLESIDFEEKFEIMDRLSADNLTIIRTLNTGKWSKLDKTESGSFSVKGQMVLKRNNKGDLKIFRYMYNSNPSEEANSPQSMKGGFAHVVYFWLKEPSNKEVRQKFVTSLSKFIDNSAFIQSKHLGTPADTDRAVIDNSYTYCLIVTFNSKEDQDKYQTEEGHLKFLEESRNLWEKVLVYDSENLE